MASIRPRPLLAALLLALAGSASATEVPPADAKPLSQILEAVEKNHPGVIVSADFDERRWEVVSCSADGRSCRELRIDPRSAKTLRDSRDMNFDIRPPAGGKSAAQIAHTIEERKLGTISEIEFDDPVWEVTVNGNGVRAKLYVDPVSGDIQRCRGRGCPAR
ncbi:MAG TPA: PepSY domain-containing protein [Rubrivivax sp.]|nr:PepSY domain-containing protein [Rubrivivax sp.]